jgi:two-component system, OmpR family, KDP operon response regulator KdpE
VTQSVKRGLARREVRLQARTGYDKEVDVDETAPVVAFSDGTVVDLARRVVQYGNQILHLTPAEGRLLRVFFESPGRVFSHRELVLLVQGYTTAQHEAPEILRPLVSRLRHKLDEFPALKDCVVSVRGTGYVYEEPRPENPS